MRWLTSRFALIRQSSSAELTLAFALGTFQTCLLTLVAILALHVTGDLADQLEALDTLLGIGLFLLVWIVTVYCTLSAWIQLDVRSLSAETPDLLRVILYSEKWGALDGYFVSLLLAAVVLGTAAVSFVASGTPEGLIFVAVFGTLGTIVAGVVAMVIGGVLGLIAALIELPLVVMARSVAGRPGSGGDARS